jgi:hypothetical protein
LAFTNQGFKDLGQNNSKARQDAMAHTISNLPPREPITQLDRKQKVAFREL